MNYEIRLVIAMALACLLGCTSTTTLRPGEIGHNGRLEGTFRFRLVNGDTFTTDRVTLDDSVFVVTAKLIDGRRERVAPLVIRLADVASVERVHLNVPVTLVAGIAVGLVIAFFVVLSRVEWTN